MKFTQWDSSWPEFINREYRHELLKFWEVRFGIPVATFTPYEMASSSRVVYLIRRSPHITACSSLRITRAGLPFMRNAGRHRKPTTEAVQLFGHLATRNVLDLHISELSRLCRLGEINVDFQTDAGFIFIRDNAGGMWGCGLFLPPSRLLCRLPKGMKAELAALSH